MAQQFLGNDLQTVNVALNAVLVKSERMPESAVEVRGYDFNKGVDYKELLKSMAQTGFQATAFSQAVDEVKRMINWRLSDEEIKPEEKEDPDLSDPLKRQHVKCKIFLGYTSNLISSGLRESIRYLVEHKKVDVVVTSAGGVEEDLIKCLGPTYLGSFSLPGKELRMKGLNRIGNLLVPNANYCLFEDWVTPLLDEMLAEQKEKNIIWTPSRIIWRLGERINDPSSVCYWAAKNRIPIYCPALTDGSLGDMIYFHSFKNPGLIVDIAGDIRSINDTAVFAKKTGMIILGGGVIKHHIANANLMRNGADYAVYINTGQEFDGSDSGARPDEAVSWGKIRMTAEPVKVYADASLGRAESPSNFVQIVQKNSDKSPNMKTKTKATKLADRSQPTITQFVQRHAAAKKVLGESSNLMTYHEPTITKSTVAIVIDDSESTDIIGKTIKNVTFKVARRIAGYKKPIRFKGFKVEPKTPNHHLELNWMKLKSAINSIHLKKASDICLEELYKGLKICETLCMQDHGEYMYHELHCIIKRRVIELTMTFKETNAKGITVLREVGKIWDVFCDEQVLIRNVFMYLDRTYILRNSEVKSVIELGHDLFRQHFFNSPDIKDILVNSFVECVNEERNGKNVSRDLLRSCSRMLMSLGVYVMHFESKFLMDSTTYYQVEADALLNSRSLGSFLDVVERRLKEETERCSPSGYLSAGTRKGLLSAILKNFLEQKAEKILSLCIGYFETSFKQMAFKDLGRLFCLLKRVSKEKTLKAAFELQILDQGRVLVKDSKYPPTFISDLLSFVATVKKFVKEVVEGHKEFEVIGKDALCKVLDYGENKIPQMFATHIDQHLRQKNVEDGEDSIDRLMDLFRVLSGKDVFEAFYQKCLAKRLILGRCRHMHMERIILSKLKAECGPDYTAKLEGMFRDMDLSADLRQSFEIVTCNSSRSVSFNILTTGFWPAFPKLSFIVPPLFENLQNEVSAFYKVKHSGRNLQWRYSMSNCILKAKFAKGDKEILVSMIQAALLLLFNDAIELSLTDAAHRMGLKSDEVGRMLEFFTSDRLRLLTKYSRDGHDVYSVNDGFEHSLYRVKLNSGQSTDSVEDVEKVNKKVFTDRSYQVDAAIPSDVKPRVESLIEREFIERSHSDSSVYVYCA
ncbi:hypothetical protein HDU67_002014 [Dinochytrium kinnereticum]|nr:hypothetical protein HDU67_002014 [Dinochytrium kinnereticum]